MIELSKPAPEPEEMLEANDFSMIDDIMRRIGGRAAQLSDEELATYHEAWGQPGALRGGLNYYRAARMGEQVAAGGVPGGVCEQITSQSVSVPTLVIWGGERRRAAALTDARVERVGPSGAGRDHPRGGPLGPLRAPGRGQLPDPPSSWGATDRTVGGPVQRLGRVAHRRHIVDAQHPRAVRVGDHLEAIVPPSR